MLTIKIVHSIVRQILIKITLQVLSKRIKFSIGAIARQEFLGGFYV